MALAAAVLGVSLSICPPATAGEGGPAVQSLLTALSDEHIDVQSQAVSQLVDMGATAVPPLVGVLADGSDRARGLAAFALASIGDGKVLSNYTATLVGEIGKDPSWRVRANLAYVLAAIPAGSGVFDALAGCIHDQDARVRAACAMNLARVARTVDRSQSAAALFVPGLSDSDRAVRFEAAQALASLGHVDARTVKALSKQLGLETDPWVKGALADALGVAGPRAAPALPALVVALGGQAPDIVAPHVISALARIGSPALPALMAALNYPPGGSGAVTQVLEKELGALNLPLSAPLAAVLAEGSDDGRIAAARILGARPQEAEKALPPLDVALRDPVAAVRAAAAGAIGHLACQTSDTGVVPSLIDVVQDRDAEVRHAALTALGEIVACVSETQAKPDLLNGAAGKRLLNAFANSLSDPDPQVRQDAAKILGALGPAAAPVAPRLGTALLAPDSGIAEAAAGALAAIGADGLPSLIVAVRQGGSGADGSGGQAREYGLQALQAAIAEGTLDSRVDGLVPALAAALGDARAPLRVMAADDLALLGPQASSAIAALGGALRKSADADTAMQIANAMVRIGPKAVPALLEIQSHATTAARQAAAEVLAGVDLGSLAPGTRRRATRAIVQALSGSDAARLEGMLLGLMGTAPQGSIDVLAHDPKFESELRRIVRQDSNMSHRLAAQQILSSAGLKP